jgi:hypothetical protein
MKPKGHEKPFKTISLKAQSVKVNGDINDKFSLELKPNAFFIIVQTILITYMILYYGFIYIKLLGWAVSKMLPKDLFSEYLYSSIHTH